MVCQGELSAVNATTHIERNFIAGGRGWSWQRNWIGSYCIDIENPILPGVTRHVENPFRDMKIRDNDEVPAEPPSKRGLLGRLFKSNS
jgi:hypothetical protein